MNIPLFIGLETIPLHQDVVGGHGERQPSPEVVPDPMGEFLEMADPSEHRKHGFYHHTLIPFPSSAELEIGRVSFLSMKSAVRQNDHLVLEPLGQGLEAGVADIGSSAVPGADQARWLSAKHSLPPRSSDNWTCPSSPADSSTSLPGRGEATQCRSYPSLPAERGQPGTSRSRLAWTGAAGRDEYDGAAWETGAGSCGTTSDRKPWCPRL